LGKTGAIGQNLDKLDKIAFIWTKFLKMSNVVISTFLSTFGQIGQNGQHLRKSHSKLYRFFLVTFIKKSVQSVQNVQTYWYDWAREFGQNYFKMSKMSKVSTDVMSV
jgi:hypothetical protein